MTSIFVLRLHHASQNENKVTLTNGAEKVFKQPRRLFDELRVKYYKAGNCFLAILTNCSVFVAAQITVLKC